MERHNIKPPIFSENKNEPQSPISYWRGDRGTAGERKITGGGRGRR